MHGAQTRLIPLPTTDDTEEWGRVPNWPQYWVSTHGRVYREPTQNQARGMTGRIMSPCGQGSGYLQITLKHGGKSSGRTVHQLVMEVHGPPQPSPQHNTINHIDGDKHNNCLSNLEWVTKTENRLHGALVQYVEQRGVIAATQRIIRWLNNI